MSKKYTEGQRVFVKELNTLGTVVNNGSDQEPQLFIEVPNLRWSNINEEDVIRPRYIEIGDKTYTIITGIAKILLLVLTLLRAR